MAKFVTCINCDHAITFIEHGYLKTKMDCPTCDAKEQFGPGIYLPEYKGVEWREVQMRQARTHRADGVKK